MRAFIEKKVKEIINEDSYEIKEQIRAQLFEYVDQVSLKMKGFYIERKAKNNFKEDINDYILNYEILYYSPDILINKIKQFELLIQ